MHESNGTDTKNVSRCELRAATDIVLDNDRGVYAIFMDIPGIEADAVEVSVDDGELIISARAAVKSESKAAPDKVWAREAPLCGFKQRFILPKDSDADRISAHYNNGVLSIELPKLLEKQPRKIAVRELH